MPGARRDFNDIHPDMEVTISGGTPGLVSPTLTAKTPAFVGAAGAGGISGAASFAEWYTDVPGTNLSA